MSIRLRHVVGVLCIVAVAVVLLRLGGRSLGPATVRGEGRSYHYVVEQTDGAAPDEPYMMTVQVDDPDNDFSDYKAENDARIAAWQAEPQSAPEVDGRPVRVTFTSPRSYTETLEIVDSFADEYVLYRVVGASPSYGSRAMDGMGEIDPATIGEVVDPACGVAVDALGTPDPTACEIIDYSGVIHVQFTVRGGVDALVDLQEHPNVFLADSTAIVVVEELGAEYGIGVGDLAVVSLPFALFDDRVTFP